MKTKTKTKSKTTMLSSNTITSLPPSPADDRHGRMVRYSMAMLIRLVCIILCFPLPGWWKLVPAIGAIVLPYVAVVLANVGHDGEAGKVERPGGLQIYRPQASNAFPSGAESTPRPPFDEPTPTGSNADGASGATYAPGSASGASFTGTSFTEEPQPAPTTPRWSYPDEATSAGPSWPGEARREKKARRMAEAQAAADARADGTIQPSPRAASNPSSVQPPPRQ